MNVDIRNTIEQKPLKRRVISPADGAYVSRNTQQEKPKRKLGKKEILRLVIPAIVAICAVVIVLVVIKADSGYKFDESAYQYYAGAVSKVESGTKLKLGDDDKVEMKHGSATYEANLPIYLSDTQAFVTPFNMGYYAPRTEEYSMLARFSEVERTKGAQIKVCRNEKEVDVGSGFAFDGGDMYIFLEPMVVSFNGYRMELPAFSYVEAVYGGNMMVFNYDTKEIFMEPCDGTGTATSMGGEYEISLIGDSMTMSSGKKRLLYSNPEVMEPIV